MGGYIELLVVFLLAVIFLAYTIGEFVGVGQPRLPKWFRIICTVAVGICIMGFAIFGYVIKAQENQPKQRYIRITEPVYRLEK